MSADEARVVVSLARLRAHADPLATPPWPGLGPEDSDALIRRIPNAPEYPTPCGTEASLEAHAGRIRFLMRTGWTDPVAIDVGVPWAPGWRAGWIIADGNHRVAAALLRGDTVITATLGGCLRTCADMLGPLRPA